MAELVLHVTALGCDRWCSPLPSGVPVPVAAVSGSGTSLPWLVDGVLGCPEALVDPEVDCMIGVGW